MALEATLNRDGIERLVLEAYPEGVYVLAFRPGEPGPFQDHLQDNWALAKQQALLDYGVKPEDFREIPDLRIM
ncbi:MAG: hypothetical protein R3B68_14870 [Phycisphaerales bacterium]